MVRRSAMSDWQTFSKRTGFILALCWDGNFRMDIADAVVRDQFGFVNDCRLQLNTHSHSELPL